MPFRDYIPTPAGLKAWLDAMTGDEKFVLVVGCGGMSSIHLAFGHIDQTTWLAVITLTVGAYITGKTIENTAETQSNTKVAVAQTEALAVVNTSPNAGPAADAIAGLNK